MAKKIVVALICTKQKDGKRTYTAFTKEGKALETFTAGDHGQGADICHRAAKEKYRLSSAEWTTPLYRKYSHQLRMQEGE